MFSNVYLNVDSVAVETDHKSMNANDTLPINNHSFNNSNSKNKH